MLQSRLLPGPLAGRSFYGNQGRLLCGMALPSWSVGAEFDVRAIGGLAQRVPLPGKLQRRLLFHAHSQPLLAPRQHRTQGDPDCSAAEAEPPHRFPPARMLLQTNHPVGSSPDGRPCLWQAAAALRRPDPGVYAQPAPGQPLRSARLHRAHLEGAGLHRGLASFSQEVWAGPSQSHGCLSGCVPADRNRPGYVLDPAGGRPDDRSGRAGARTASPFFLAATHYAGAFLFLPQALNWLTIAQDCFADEFGSLRQGLLTSVFGLVIGLERVFHLEEMEDVGFALLCGGRECPTRQRVGAWRRHLPWYEVDAFCRRTHPWPLLKGQDALVSFDEHTIPRWTRKFHLGKGYVTTRNKYMRCEKLFCSYSLNSGRFLAVRATPGNWGLADVAVPLVQQVLDRGQPRTLQALFDAGAGKA